MTTVLITLFAVVILALIFDFINGFHDAANAVATVVSTGVLPLRTAVLLAGLLNFFGALTGTAVAATIGKGVVNPEAVTQTVVLSGLIGAIFWNLFTWYFGIPSSSSHALIGGISGAALSHSGIDAVHLDGLGKIVESLVLSPILGLALGLILMIILFWLFRGTRPSKVAHISRRLQLVSSGFMALSHGSNDAQKTMGIIAMSLAAYHAIYSGPTAFEVPTWVIILCAIAMGTGTAVGGVKIIKTMGTKIIDLKPIHGFAAETSAAATIFTASHFGLPVSTTHVISGAILGVGASRSVSAVRWGVTVKILWAWVLTIPISAAVAFCAYKIFAPLLGT